MAPALTAKQQQAKNLGVDFAQTDCGDDNQCWPVNAVNRFAASLGGVSCDQLTSGIRSLWLRV